MKARLVVSTAALLVLAALASGPPSLAGTRSVSNVITGTKSIGAYPVGAGYARARRVWGGQASSTQDSKSCTASWANGVTISWRRTLPSTNWSKVCVKFSSARVGKPKPSGPAWRTSKGLRVGAATARLRSLYPSARSKRSGAYAVWTLQKSSKVTLQAWAKKHKVAYFKLVKR